MKLKKSLLAGVVLLVFFFVFFSMNTYTSPSDFTPTEISEDLPVRSSNCHGIDIILNENEQTNVTNKSLCIGYLERVDPSFSNSSNEITSEDLTALQNQLDHRNLNQDFPVYPNEHTPSIVGTYDGMSIEEQYWCSDTCPENGILYLNIASSTEESCEQLGGTNLYKWGWGLQYIGCSPTENKYSD